MMGFTDTTTNHGQNPLQILSPSLKFAKPTIICFNFLSGGDFVPMPLKALTQPCFPFKVQSHYSLWHPHMRAYAYTLAYADIRKGYVMHTLIYIRGTLGIRCVCSKSLIYVGVRCIIHKRQIIFGHVQNC